MLPHLVVLTALQAHAFVPTDAADPGIEPSRLHVVHPEEQGRLLQGEDWQRFATTDGAGWTARFDELTGRPRWATGRGIPLPAGREIEALTELLTRHHELFGFEPGTLRVRSAGEDPVRDLGFVDFDTLRDGLPTWRGGIEARIVQGRLVHLLVQTAPGASVTGSLALGSDAAVRAAIAAGPARAAHPTEVTVEPVLLERTSLDGFELRRVYEVHSRTAVPVGRWVAFVDGETGAVLSLHNEVRFASGTVTGRVHERTVDGSPLVTAPMPLAVVSGASDATVADEDGAFTLAGSGPYSTNLNGDYVQVVDVSNPEGSLVASDADGLAWTSDDAHQSQIDTYKFLHDVQAWGLAFAPNVPWVSQKITANVNLSEVCNAYWDGNVNFFQSGGGCNNTGQIADVVYHEWGHGFHYSSLLGGTFDGSLSEGAGDTVSTLQTLDHRMGPYFFTGGSPVRDLGPDHVYPRDIVGEVHEDGLIFGGAMYDLLQILSDEHGDTEAVAITSDIFAGLLESGPRIPDSYHAALVADDDDGNLQNGTPHVCEIDEAFARHGLADGSAGGVMASHEPLVHEPAGEPHPVEVRLVDVSSGCTAVRADAGEVHYRVSGGPWQVAPMSPSGDDGVEGEIPPQGEGAFVEYYVTGTTVEGDGFAVPGGGAVDPYSFYEGDVLEIHCDDFESGDGGFTHELVQGEVADGADDWQWGTPNGRSGDPSGAYSGNKVWGNDLGHDDFNGAYQPDKWNRLVTPAVETRWYTGVFLQYRRWLSVEDARYDQAAVTANGAEVWRNWSSQGGEDQTVDGSWRNHVVDLGGVGDRGQVAFTFELKTDGGLEFGGWTLDDVCVVAPATPDNRLGIGDLVIEATGDTTARLAWTNPIHAPLAKVRVVRSVDGLPGGAASAPAVWETDAPALGERVEIEDTNYHAGSTWYAVYGFDGTDWLSFTLEGMNAREVTLVGGTPPEGVQTVDGRVVTADDPASVYASMGCACDGTGATQPLLGLGALVGAMVGTRRRR